MTRLKWYQLRRHVFRKKMVSVTISKNTGTIYRIVKGAVYKNKGKFQPWHWRMLYVGNKFLGRFALLEEAKEAARQHHT